MRSNAAMNDEPPPLSSAPPHELLPAAKEGDVPTVVSALRNPLTDPNMADGDGWTALIHASIKGHASVVSALLDDERVDPNKTDLLRNQSGALP